MLGNRGFLGNIYPSLLLRSWVQFLVAAYTLLRRHATMLYADEGCPWHVECDGDPFVLLSNKKDLPLSNTSIFLLCTRSNIESANLSILEPASP